MKLLELSRVSLFWASTSASPWTHWILHSYAYDLWKLFVFIKPSNAQVFVISTTFYAVSLYGIARQYLNILFYTFKYIALCLGKHIYNDLLCRKRILSQHTYINKIKEEKRSEMKMLWTQWRLPKKEHGWISQKKLWKERRLAKAKEKNKICCWR